MRFLLVVVLAWICIFQTAHARQSCDWPFRTSVTINEITGLNSSNYQVKLTLTGGSGGTLNSGYTWSNNGEDLRVYAGDDTSPLSFSIASWNANTQIAEVWVTLPTLAANSSETIYVYYGNRTVSTADTGMAPSPSYVDGRIKFHTRSTTADPSSYGDAKALFDGLSDNTSGYQCSHPTIFDSITNRTQSPSGGSGDFIAYSEALFTVPVGGTWGVRYGADYGRGGGLYVNGVPLDERWNENLWWNNNWNDPDVLSGFIPLTAGEHKLEIIGAEDCCDGGLTIQFYNPDTGQWGTNVNVGVDVRSLSCPVNRHTISYGAHDTCDTDLRIRNQDTDLDSNTTWEINVPKTVDVRIRNTGSATYPSPIPSTINLTLPNGFILQNSSGVDWQTCTQTNNVVTCLYNTSINRRSESSYVNLTLMAANGTATGAATISAEAITSGYEVNPADNINNFSINVVNNGALPAVTPSCTPDSGIFVRFFDTTGYTGSGNYPNILNATDMQTFVDDNRNVSQLDGQTILSNINGSENAFNDPVSDPNDEYFLTIFEGYIRVPTTDDYTFDIDGDDAVEFRLGGSVITSYYDLHATAGVPQNQQVIRLAEGYHAIEYRMQEHTGGAVYRLYSRQGGGNIRSTDITPNSYFYHCAGDPNIQVQSQITVVSDPINGTSSPKAIPGAVVTQTITVSNEGQISTDRNSTDFTQVIAADSQLYVSDFISSGPVEFTDQASPNNSGLSYVFSGLSSTTDSLSFSNDNGSTFNYVPVPDADGYDANVTHFRLDLSGSFRPVFSGTSPGFQFRYQLKVD